MSCELITARFATVSSQEGSRREAEEVSSLEEAALGLEENLRIYEREGGERGGGSERRSRM